MPLRPKGPPLNSLRAFEAAARLQSFTAASDELNVTSGAIAQQIKALESQYRKRRRQAEKDNDNEAETGQP